MMETKMKSRSVDFLLFISPGLDCFLQVMYIPADRTPLNQLELIIWRLDNALLKHKL